jgi:hypothetical protein
LSNIKGSAIPYAGYDYQTLHGVRLLLDWVSNPNLYTQIALEADTSQEDIPPAIEDIVCKRKDGTFEYYQVKFTTDEIKHELSWDWLLAKTKKGRSLAKKLFDGLNKLNIKKVFTAQLVTNRIPSEELNACFNGKYIDYLKLNTGIKLRLLDELGTEDNIKSLFSILCFEHSKKDLSKLKIDIISDTFSIRKSDSIYRLLDEAKDWAIHKNKPNLGGWILLSDIKNILSDRRPSPLPQSFSIPKGYVPPCEVFHVNFVKKITKKKESILVVTGPPGRGKSTYLSFLVTEIDKLSIPYIRHHYFISNDDRTGDRFSHRAVQSDLSQQLENFHGYSGNDFQKQLEACAEGYAKENKKLVILIDGLDHVWRNNYEDRKPLDSLFEELLPPIENVVYIIGTQPVDDEKLPNKLLKYKKRNSWLELPAMTGNSILQYLEIQIKEERLQLFGNENRKEDELSESSKALLELTLGHPLSVIYATEFISINKISLRAYEIERMPKIYGDHVDEYYSELWRKISYPQKYLLHTLCEFNFGWNKNDLNELFSISAIDDHVSGVQHLLYQTRIGYKPFHESLIVFVKNLPEHDDSINQHLDLITKWVEQKAPENIRNTWGFRCNLKKGCLGLVKNELTRTWIVDRISEGYFPRQLEDILENASLAFIEARDMVEPHRFRTVKTRISNIEQNVHELDSLITATLRLAPVAVINEYIAIAQHLNVIDIAQLSTSLYHRGEKVDASFINELAKDRYNSNNRLRGDKNNFDSDISSIFRSSVLLEQDISENINKFGESFYSGVISSCVEGENLNSLFKYHSIFESKQYKQIAETSAYRVSFVIGANTEIVLEETSFKYSAFLKFARRIKLPLSDSEYFLDFPEDRSSIKTNCLTYSEEFFSTLMTLSDISGDCSWLKFNVQGSAGYDHEKSPQKIHDAILTGALDLLETIRFSGSVTFSSVLESIINYDLEFTDHWQQRSVNEFKHEFVIIAVDCHLLFKKTLIDLNELKFLLDSNYYNVIRFFHWYSELKLPIITDEALDHLLLAINQEVCNSDIQERINLNIACALVLLTHKKENEANIYIRKSWDLAIGYGSYKDSTINEIVCSIEYLFDIRPSAAINALEKISPFIANFDDLTTEGSSPNNDINEVLAKGAFNTLASKYRYELKKGEAYLANNTLNALFEYANLSSIVLNSLCRTGLLNDNLLTLKVRAEKGDTRALELLNIALKHNGSSSIKETDKRFSNSKSDKFELTNKDIHKYPPDKFLDFTKAFKNKYLYEEHYLFWFSYWVDKGKQKELLSTLVPIALTGKCYELKYLLDSLYELTLGIEGKKKAFELIVAAHNQNNGWSSYYDSKKSFQRLDIVVDIYSDRVEEFIAKTTYNSFEKGLNLPYQRYSYLLSKLARGEEAEEFVYSLTAQLTDEIKILTPEIPNWQWGSQKDDLVILDLLIARLMTPIAAIKWWVAQALVELLITEEFSLNTEIKLLYLLNECKLESECIEVLSIFYFAYLKGYNPNESIPLMIKQRSYCSDYIIDKMGLSPDSSRYGFNLNLVQLNSNENFRKSFASNNGSNFPSVYIGELEELDKKTRFPLPIPLSEIMISEWCNMLEGSSNYDSAIRYYINSDGYTKDQTALIYPATGLMARSAYLRALEFAKINYKLPQEIHEFHANIAYPFDSILFNLKPLKPKWADLPVLTNSEIKSIESFVRDILSSINSSSPLYCLGALSFGLEIDSNTFIEVEVLRCIVDDLSTQVQEDSPWLWRVQETALDNQNKIESATDIDNKPNFLVAKAYPFKHYGHWHSEIDSRGVFAPVNLSKEQEVYYSLKGNNIVFTLGESEIAKYGFWNNNWQPSYNSNLNPHSATYTLLNSKNKPLWIENDLSEGLFCKVVKLSRTESHGDFESSNFEFYIQE